MRAAVSASIWAMARALVQTSKRRGWRACTARRMFSSIGRVGNRLVIWNERPMPARQMRSGGRPEMSSAPSRIVPASGGNMPETRLKAVVLPAPLGPISACSVRSRTEKAASSTALMPPKCFTMPSAFSTGPSRWDDGLQEFRQRRVAYSAAGHRRRLENSLAERCEQAAGDAHQPAGREQHEADEQQAEPQQPVLAEPRQIVPEDDEEQRAERRAEERAHAADHDHGQQLAGERNRDRVRRGHAVVEQQQAAGKSRERGRQREGDELVAVGRIADELRALLVLADGDQHVARGRAMEAPEQIHHQEADARDQAVIGGVVLQAQTGDVRAHDAAEAVLAAGHGRPAESHHVHHGGQCHRQQREIDAAAAQDQVAEGGGDEGDDDQRRQHRQQHRSAHHLALQQRGDVGRKAEPGAMTERDQPRVADQDVERHAGHGEDDDLRRRGDAETEALQRERQDDERCGRDQQRGTVAQHACLTRTAGCARRTGRAGETAGSASSGDRWPPWKTPCSRRR